MHARYSSSEASGSEQGGISVAAETGESSDGDSTAASSLSAQESASPEPEPVAEPPVDPAQPKFAFAFE